MAFTTNPFSVPLIEGQETPQTHSGTSQTVIQGIDIERHHDSSGLLDYASHIPDERGDSRNESPTHPEGILPVTGRFLLG